MKRLFKNKKTQEVFILVDEDENFSTLVSLHDGKWSMIGESARNDFEEISVAPVKVKAVPTKIRTIIQTDKETTFDDVQEILNSEELLSEHFHVNDIFYIPVEYQDGAIPFEIVHVAEDTRSIYLMSRDILTRKAMSEVADWLDDFSTALPDDIWKHLKPIEHTNCKGTYRSHTSLPSKVNMGWDESQCTGADDIKFDKFKDEASRCKNFENETICYRTDTPFIAFSANFWIVTTYGGCSYNIAANAYGICPLIKLSKDEQEQQKQKEND